MCMSCCASGDDRADRADRAYRADWADWADWRTVRSVRGRFQQALSETMKKKPDAVGRGGRGGDRLRRQILEPCRRFQVRLQFPERTASNRQEMEKVPSSGAAMAFGNVGWN